MLSIDKILTLSYNEHIIVYNNNYYFRAVDNIETLIKELKSNSCKITPQRMAIYQIIKESMDHPNAETVFKKLSPTYPTMSLATVYKSLELFSKLDLIQVINLGEHSFRYDGITDKHQHILCTKCSKIEDINDAIFQSLQSEVENISKYKVDRQQICFYGVCENCLSK